MAETKKREESAVIGTGALIGGNKLFPLIAKNLQDSFSPDRVRRVDTQAMYHSSKAIFYWQTDAEGKALKDNPILAFPAGQYLSNIEIDAMKPFMEDVDFQKNALDTYREAGYIVELDEIEASEAKVLPLDEADEK